MEFKKYDFFCPHCSAQLNKKDGIILHTKRVNGDEGVITMDVAVGKYTYTHEPPVKFEKGEVVDFFCPACKTDLQSNQYDNFARMLMRVGKNIEFDILFSREAGKRKTFIITEDGIESYSER